VCPRSVPEVERAAYVEHREHVEPWAPAPTFFWSGITPFESIALWKKSRPDEFDDVVLGVEVLGPDQVEHPLGLGSVVVLSGRVSPARVGENEGGRHVLFAVRRSTAGHFRARGRALPRASCFNGYFCAVDYLFFD